jgi:hypothetical protein
MAKKDLVAVLAKLLEGFVPPMGYAGVFGFNDPDLCLAWNDPRSVGEQWDTMSALEKARVNRQFWVHNITHRGLSHSDYFVGLAHAQTFWLPFFWEIPVGLFDQFKDLCIECRDLEEAKRFHDLTVKEELLSTSSWGWTDGKLNDRVRVVTLGYLKHMNREPANIDQIVALSIRNLWHLVWRATQRSTQNLYGLFLYPHTALVQAIETTIEQTQHYSTLPTTGVVSTGFPSVFGLTELNPGQVYPKQL